MSLLPHELELLAPARDVEIGRQAILHGADAVYVLSACRAFNEDLYFHLGESLKCNPSHAAFA